MVINLPGFHYTKVKAWYYGNGQPGDFQYYNNYLQIGFFPYCWQKHWHS